MKKFLLILLCLILCLICLTAFAESLEYEYTQSLQYGSFTVNIPSTFKPDEENPDIYAAPGIGITQIQFVGYQNVDYPLYSNTGECIAFLNAFLADVSTEGDVHIVQADECAALQQVIANDALSFCFLFICNQNEVLVLNIMCVGYNSEDNCMSLANGILDHIVAPENFSTTASTTGSSAPVAEKNTQDGFSQDVTFGSFTVYIPSTYTYNAEKDEYVDSSAGAKITFGNYNYMEFDLYSDSENGIAYLDGFVKDNESHEYRQADECPVLIRHLLSSDQLGTLDMLLICNKKEVLSITVNVSGANSKARSSELIDGILSHIVAPETPTIQ